MCVFLSCRPFVVNTIFSTGIVGVEVTFVVNTTFSTVLVSVEVTSVSWLGQLTVGV